MARAQLRENGWAQLILNVSQGLVAVDPPKSSVIQDRAELLRIVDRRLEATKALESEWSLLVLAACESGDMLNSVLEGHAPAARAKIAAAEKQAARPGAYLSEITVEGFRGVGPKRTLELA